MQIPFPDSCRNRRSVPAGPDNWRLPMTKKKCIPFKISLITVLLLLALVSICSAETALKAVTESWPPFRINSDEAENGFVGIDVDILKGLEQFLGRKIIIDRHPFARALEMIRTGDADITPGIAFTDQRNEFISYVPTSYFSVAPVFLTQKGKGRMVRSYDDLYRFKIGYSLHSAYFEPFNTDEKLDKLGVATEEQLIKMAALGRIDLIIGTNPNLLYDVKRFGFKEKVELTSYRPEKNTPLFIGLSRKKHESSGLSEKINTYIRHLVSSGELDRILGKYR